MNSTVKELFERKSVRVYKDKEIEPEKKQLILESAIQAPTAGNMTLYSIIDIQDQEIKDKLAKSCDNQPFIAKAPLVLIFVADYQKWYDAFKYYHDNEKVREPSYGDFLLAYSDALIAALNAVVAGESMGIGSCFIGDIIEQYEYHRELLNLPQYCAPVAMLVMGYPTDQQKRRPKPVRFDSKYIVSTDKYERFSSEKLVAMFDDRAIKANKTSGGKGYVDDIYNRKWTNPFIEEMTRSSKLWFEQWGKEDEES